MRRTVPWTSGCLAIAGGVLSIVGWKLNISFLKDPFHTNFIEPSTALCLIVAGTALILQQFDFKRWVWKIPAALCSIFVLLVGLLTTLEYFTHLDFGIDQLFLAGKLGQWNAPNVLPGRLAPNTAVAFTFLGLALLFPKSRVGRSRLSELFSLPVLLISFLSIVGYSYKAEPLYGFGSYSSMSLQAAIFLAALSIGVLWSRSDYGIMSLVLSHDAGGIVARRLLLATIITLPLLGWLHIQAETYGILPTHFGTALLVIISVLVFAFMIVQAAYILRELDIKRKLAEESLLRSHAELESLVSLRTISLRHLSMRLMRLQDEERRKIARELHDGLGQFLASLAINLDRIAKQSPTSAGLVTESRAMLDQAISEMRTLSHLLHPPLLDEVGFASAATWFVEGFSKRSGIQMKLDLPSTLPRLPQSLELGLFRVLQESLTNLHRHSGSPRGDVCMHITKEILCLHIRDYGKGIPATVLERWRDSGIAGVGLAGMKERVSEFGGKLEIMNPGDGTLVQVTVPLSEILESLTGEMPASA